MERVIAYIDGFNLYFGLRSKGWRRYYWLDPSALAANLLKRGQTLVTTNYFTARIAESSNNPGKQKRQTTYLEAIASTARTAIHYGHYLRKPQQCFQCGATWNSHEEKMTDVNIAVEMLKDAFADRFDTALLLSADSDLTAPVEAVRSLFPDKRVVVACPPRRQSKRLESVAHAYIRIGRKKLHESQLPVEIRKPDGFLLRRPSKWNNP